MIGAWIGEVFLLGLKNLRRNKLRSLLTMLGMIFGVGSVIAMLSVGAGARAEILARIGELGVRNIIVNSVEPPEQLQGGDETQWVNRYGLEFVDAERIEESCPTVERILRVNAVRERVWLGSRRVDASILGVEPEHLLMFQLDVSRGRVFNRIDFERASKVCIVRRGLLRKLETVRDPIGMTLRLGGHPFEVIGILEDESFRSHTRKALAIDERVQEIYVPYSTAMRIYGTFSYVFRTGTQERSSVELDQIIVEATDAESVRSTARMVASILDHGHDRQEYEIVVPLELLRQSERTQQVFNVVMVLIAGISLLIGGIGIANIMLATISERTKEIGIRRALGARRSDVIVQFLMETLAIAVIGGLLGSLFGVAGVEGIVRFTEWNATIAPSYLALSILISCSVGILSGLYPARRAAHMDPIAALRFE